MNEVLVGLVAVTLIVAIAGLVLQLRAAGVFELLADAFWSTYDTVTGKTLPQLWPTCATCGHEIDPDYRPLNVIKTQDAATAVPDDGQKRCASCSAGSRAVGGDERGGVTFASTATHTASLSKDGPK
ncbi:hypothetical protein [Microbacterium sp. NIBRBAC000506063]|uniref:hypothetical protein n=1 Tax=Microbacterium sp. NIBRBAC000506063 TaxID=2734618 RepID=UPI001BB5FCEB|nr:hypothetical protein [Microbacterium sp. NIBRBAC000506063]QTV79446.1 hypothetical protein KAE78_11120 [Microbacterium sp. NIBRBAC000506063]